MAKVNQGYPSLLGGVSQQDPALRKGGQHWEQVNMVVDPVLGLTRRPGSLRVTETSNGGATEAPANSATRAFDFRVAGTDYSLIAPVYGRSGARSGWPDITCVSRTAAGGAAIPVSFVGNATRNTALKASGISAACSVGSILLLSSLAAMPAYTTEYQWQTAENMKRHIVWIRGGAYSRTYAMSLVRGNQKLTVEYTTLSASYPEVLDTSDLDPNAPDYLKQVNDRTNAYNTAATQWIGAALSDATPENIATQLAAALKNSGFLLSGSTVEVIGSTICITDAATDDIEVNDGADNSLMRGVGNTVSAPELLSIVAYPGKVVKVRPNLASEGNVFYMEAVSKDGSSGAFTAVAWEECPGVKFTPTEGLFFATVSGGTCYIATSPASLRAAAGVEFPDYLASVAGNEVSSAPPAFLTKGITYLGLFQDRLLIGGGNELASSRPGDYLNFWRASVLTVAKNDPVVFTVIGGEDDVLRHSVIYDRNLVIFGDKRQYLIDGRKTFEPNTASAAVMATFPEAVQVPPVLSGNFMFYARSTKGYTSIHQFSPGQIVESPVSTEITREVPKYIRGNPVELVVSTQPNRLFVRTDADPSTVYVYSFVDAEKGGAWDKWVFNTGTFSGMSTLLGYLYLMGYRKSAASQYVTSDRVPLFPGPHAHPYLDSCTTTGPLGTKTSDDPETTGPFSSVWHVANVPVDGYAVATGAAGNYVGTADSAATLVPTSSSVWEGFIQDGYVTLSSPYFRDSNGAAMQIGRLTVGNIRLELADVGGLTVQVNNGRGQECWRESFHGYVESTEDLDGYIVGPDCAVKVNGVYTDWIGHGPAHNEYPPDPYPGWFDPISTGNMPGAGVPAWLNSGTFTHDYELPVAMYYGVVDAQPGDVITWNHSWEPLEADPSPLVSTFYGAAVAYWSEVGSFGTQRGTLRVWPTVNGVESTHKLIAVSNGTGDGGGGYYTEIAWGPDL